MNRFVFLAASGSQKQVSVELVVVVVVVGDVVGVLLLHERSLERLTTRFDFLTFLQFASWAGFAPLAAAGWWPTDMGVCTHSRAPQPSPCRTISWSGCPGRAWCRAPLRD